MSNKTSDAEPSADAQLAIDVRGIELGEIETEPFPDVDQEFRVFIAEDAFDSAVEQGSAAIEREVGGVLVGVVRQDESGPYVKVETTIEALHAEEKGAELTFTHATWEHIHAEMDAKHEGKRVLGWYHTHPGFGIFLSDRDEFIHKSFFDLPFQIALVYDPRSREHGVFTWRQGGLYRTRRYWVGRSEHWWDGSRVEPGSPKDGDGDGDGGKVGVKTLRERGGYDEGAEGGRVDWFVTAFCCLLTLIIAGFGGWWWGTRSASEVLQQANTEIARAHLKGAQDVAKGLNAELLGVVRAALGDHSTRTTINDVRRSIDRAHALLVQLEAAPAGKPAGKPDAQPEARPGSPGGAPAAGSDPADPETPGAEGDEPDEATSTAKPPSRAELARKLARELDAARRTLDLLLRERRDIEAALAQLESASQRTQKAEKEALGLQRNALGALYSELARDLVESGDKRRAARYLVTAARVDPANHAQYEKLLRTFDKKTPIGSAPRSERTRGPRRPRAIPPDGDPGATPEGQETDTKSDAKADPAKPAPGAAR